VGDSLFSGQFGNVWKCLYWNLFPDPLFPFTTMTITLAANNNSVEVIRVLKCP